MKQRFGLSGYQLKMIAIVFMFLDHFYSHVANEIGLSQSFIVFDWLSRFVSPLFMFLMVEGFFYTRNRKKYLERLLGAGAIMAVGNVITHLIMHTSISFFDLLAPNIFLSLAGGFGIIWLIDTIIEKKKWWLVLPILLLAVMTSFTEASAYAVVITCIMYAAKKANKKWILYTGITIFAIYTFYNLTLHFTDFSYLNLSYNNEFLFITVLPFIYLYNGEKGGKGTPFEKNFFYGFYPIHIWILYIIGQLLAH